MMTKSNPIDESFSTQPPLQRLIMRLVCLLLFCASSFTLTGCQDDSPSMVAPPPGAKVLTDEERAEFNENALDAMAPKD